MCHRMEAGAEEALSVWAHVCLCVCVRVLGCEEVYRGIAASLKALVVRLVL